MFCTENVKNSFRCNVKTALIDWSFRCVPEVQCETFHQNHVVWQTKIKVFDGMEMIRNNRIEFVFDLAMHACGYTQYRLFDCWLTPSGKYCIYNNDNNKFIIHKSWS